MWAFGVVQRGLTPDPSFDIAGSDFGALAGQAEQGYTGGQSNLGGMYANGEGVPQDDVEAYKWFSLATTYADEVERDIYNLADKRDVVAERLTPEQRAEGQKLSREWFAAHPRDSPPSPLNRHFCAGI